MTPTLTFQRGPAAQIFIPIIWLLLLGGCQHPSKSIKIISDFKEALEIAKSGTGLSRFAIIQGATSSDQTQIAILHKLEDKLDAFLGTEVSGLVNWSAASERLIGTFDGSPWQISHFIFRGLNARGTYVVRVTSTSGDLLDMRQLSTLDTSTRTVRFGVLSCMDDSMLKDSGSMWDDLVQHNPNFLVFLGDTVYVDKRNGNTIPTDPRTIWDRYVETRNLLPIFRNPQLVPIFATWDDHDYGINDGDRNYPYKEEAKRTFNYFFPQAEIPGFFQRGEGVSSAFTGWEQQFVLMDDRSFRTAPSESKNQTHWGTKQEDWLFKKLKKDGPPTWIFNGDQFFGKYHKFESYEGRHPASFKRFLATLKKQRPIVAFVSGDRHLTELMEIKAHEFGLATYELTSSPFHAQTYIDGWVKNPNPRKIDGASGILNYAIVETEAVNRSGLKFHVTSFGLTNRPIFDRRLSVGKSQ